MTKKAKPSKPCHSCAGHGTVCCQEWAEVRVRAGDDLRLNPSGLPEWPLLLGWEMNRCPFCGKSFDIIRRHR
ncbi:MAG: hypothetical protein AAB262_03975 [Elusimicrobiota bacterium]